MPATEFAGTVYTSQFALTKSVDPPSIAAGAAADVAVPDTNVKAGDLVQIATIPPALDVGLVVQGIHSVAAGTFSLRLVNRTAGAIDAAAANWTFVVLRR